VTLPTTADLAALRDLAVSAATEAGRLLLGALHDDRELVGTKSTSTDMVTEMDGASEALLVERIVAARPDDAILGEEGAARPGTTGVRWVIDPLDGTTNYLYRLPGWNVSVGVEVDGEPVAGAVVVPSTGDSFSAAAGLGATLNGAPIHLAEAAPLGTSLVGTGFAYDPEVRRRQAAALVDLVPQVRDIRRGGAAAADLCAVAAGRLDAYYETGLAPWDRCAGSVIAGEAGARVEVLEEHPLPGVLTIAGHPERWDELIGLLRSVGVVT
jgi:myo-inositol-1(or 4)-monophosphatase